jgi:hypothetical protein
MEISICINKQNRTEDMTKISQELRLWLAVDIATSRMAAGFPFYCCSWSHSGINSSFQINHVAAKSRT